MYCISVYNKIVSDTSISHHSHPLETLKTWDLRSQRSAARRSLGPSTPVDVSMGKGYMCITSTQNEVPLELNMYRIIRLLSWYMHQIWKWGEGILKTNSSTKEDNMQLAHFRNKTRHLGKLRSGHVFFSNCRLSHTRCSLMPGDHLGRFFWVQTFRGGMWKWTKNLTESRPTKSKWDCLDHLLYHHYQIWDVCRILGWDSNSISGILHINFKGVFTVKINKHGIVLHIYGVDHGIRAVMSIEDMIKIKTWYSACVLLWSCNEFTLKIRQILMHSHYVSTVSWSRRVTQLTRQLTLCFTKDGVSVLYRPISIMYSHVLLNLFRGWWLWSPFLLHVYVCSCCKFTRKTTKSMKETQHFSHGNVAPFLGASC